MKLITKELEKRFAALGEQDVADPIVVAKFFNPTGGQTWLAIAYNPEDRVIFCYASLFNDYNNELGYTSIDELESIRGPLGLGIERDLWWTECPLSEAKRKENIV